MVTPYTERLDACRAELSELREALPLVDEPRAIAATMLALLREIATLEGRELAWHSKRKAESEIDIPEYWR
tara:strand:+ start:273 stop:485 length:213 start_codon:yes stop_codon:yes gene_type:complete